MRTISARKHQCLRRWEWNPCLGVGPLRLGSFDSSGRALKAGKMALLRRLVYCCSLGVSFFGGGSLQSQDSKASGEASEGTSLTHVDHCDDLPCEAWLVGSRARIFNLSTSGLSSPSIIARMARDRSVKTIARARSLLQMATAKALTYASAALTSATSSSLHSCSILRSSCSFWRGEEISLVLPMTSTPRRRISSSLVSLGPRWAGRRQHSEQEQIKWKSSCRVRWRWSRFLRSYTGRYVMVISSPSSMSRMAWIVSCPSFLFHVLWAFCSQAWLMRDDSTKMPAVEWSGV